MENILYLYMSRLCRSNNICNIPTNVRNDVINTRSSTRYMLSINI